jgi:cytochrome c556
MLKRSKIVIMTAALGVVVAMGVQAAAPTDVIKERQDGLKSMGKIFKSVADQLRAGNLDPATVKEASATITKTADAMANWFPAGSGTEAGVKTAAKPEIWSDNATFMAARQKLVEEAGKFAALANAGDMASIGGGVRGLGGACKGCHDKFRVKED